MATLEYASQLGYLYKKVTETGFFVWDEYLTFTHMMTSKRAVKAIEASQPKDSRVLDVGAGECSLFWLMLLQNQVPVDYLGYDYEDVKFNWVRERWYDLERLIVAPNREEFINDILAKLTSSADPTFDNLAGKAVARAMGAAVKKPALAKERALLEYFASAIDEIEIITNSNEEFVVRYRMSGEQQYRTFTYRNSVWDPAMERSEGLAADNMPEIAYMLGISENTPVAEEVRSLIIRTQAQCPGLRKLVFSVLVPNAVDRVKRMQTMMQIWMARIMPKTLGAKAPILNFHQISDLYPVDSMEAEVFSSFGSRGIVLLNIPES